MAKYFLGSERKKKSNESSPESGEPVFLAIGKIRKPHGLRGELVLEVLTDFPECIIPGKMIYLGENKESHLIQSIREKGKNHLIAFERFPDLDSVEKLRNAYVYIVASSLPSLPNSEYYHHELLGLSVYTEEGENIGTIEEILTTGANDVYVLTSGREDKQELLIPAIESVVLEVDLANRKMIVKLQEWK
ncbi:MAG TPA: 16S rRNA processing protein RimM [Anaerolineae bacterium]|nr:16S rRNA processing protein RimM [Anaerolineae bacterium]